MLEQEGLFFFQPVYKLLLEGIGFLNLRRSSISVCYKTYHNTHKGIQIGSNEQSLQDAVDQGLTPGSI